MKSQFTGDFYKSFFDNMIDGVARCRMIFDEGGNPVDFVYLKINKTFRILMKLGKAAGKKSIKAIPGINASNHEFFSVCARVSLTGRPERVEIYIDPPAKWFYVSVYSLRNNFFVVLFQDITDRKQVDKNLENAKIAARNVLEDLSVEKSKVEIAKAKEEAILLSIGEGLLATDEKGNIILVNNVAEKMLGKKREEFMGKIFSEAVAIEDQKGLPILLKDRPVSMALSDAVTTSSTTTGPAYYYVRKNKTKFPVAIMVTPVILGGKVIGTIEVFRDITREKEIDKAKTEFVSLASHQLRTPLSAVNWYTEMLLAGDAGSLNKEQKKYLEAVYKGNQRMVVLVNALLNVSRLEIGEFVIEPGPTDVIEVMQGAIDEQKVQIGAKRITLSFSPEKGIPVILADSKLLRMVVQNILSNAVKYTAEGGKIGIEIFMADKDNILLEIIDTGYGIPKKQQDQIFTKLFRADNAREKDTEGTGLGLYIAKSIVEHSAGKIWFESEEGKGTAFYVMLPVRGVNKKECAVK